MIFVSVGTHNEQFDRLLREMDRIVGSGVISDKVIAQTGSSTYKPRNFRHFNFSEWKNITKLNKDAEIVVTHGGAGNLLMASHFMKPIVAVPRMKKFGEHVNDHQLQLVRELERQGRVIAVYDIHDLSKAIAKAKTYISKKRKFNRKKRIVAVVDNYLSILEKKE